MKTKVEQPVALVCTFTWLGFVCAISFLEAWLKFRAPGVTLPIGLGIGRLVFAALNKVELVFALAIMISHVLAAKSLQTRFKAKGPFIAVLLMLTIQTLWLLPALDARAALYINGQHVAPSNLHIYYVLTEMIKVSALFLSGLKLFKPLSI